MFVFEGVDILIPSSFHVHHKPLAWQPPATSACKHDAMPSSPQAGGVALR